MKRTTLILEEGCLEGIKNLARRQDRTMSDVVNEILAEGIQRRTAKAVSEFELPAYEMGEARVNLGDRDALEAAMED
jgi:hypothetical protein